MTTTQKFRQLLAEYGREVTLEEVEQIVRQLRETFGVAFSAAGMEWDEDRIVAEARRSLEFTGRFPDAR